MKIYKKHFKLSRLLSVPLISLREIKARLGQALLPFLPEFLSLVSWKAVLSFYKCNSTYGSYFIWNNQGHKLVQWSKEYYLKSYKSSHNPTPPSATMLHAFTLLSSPFYAAKFISTVRLGGKKLSEAEGAEYSSYFNAGLLLGNHSLQWLWKDSTSPRPQWKWINQN